MHPVTVGALHNKRGKAQQMAEGRRVLFVQHKKQHTMERLAIGSLLGWWRGIFENGLIQETQKLFETVGADMWAGVAKVEVCLRPWARCAGVYLKLPSKLCTGRSVRGWDCATLGMGLLPESVVTEYSNGEHYLSRLLSSPVMPM
jgi:hypothetical protein